MPTTRPSSIVALALTLHTFSPPGWAQVCTREYAPVCAQVPGEGAPRTFANRCLMRAAQASLIAEGLCAKEPELRTPPVGADVDAHGCKPSTGHTWNQELNACVRPWMSKALTLEVAPQRQTCMGMAEQQCLMVREVEPGRQPGPWLPLFSPIGGYTHQAGEARQLRVRQDRVENPPADAPSATYTLIKVLQ